MTLQVGDKAPDFSLPSTTDDAPIRLSELQGQTNVVLLFVPFAWSTTCTHELCSVRDDYSRYQELDAQVLGISADSPFSLAAWAAEQDFPFALLSDFNREVAALYDALYEELLGFKGVPKRAVYVIDKGGRIRHQEICRTPRDLPDFEAVREALSQAA